MNDVGVGAENEKRKTGIWLSPDVEFFESVRGTDNFKAFVNRRGTKGFVAARRLCIDVGLDRLQGRGRCSSTARTHQWLGVRTRPTPAGTMNFRGRPASLICRSVPPRLNPSQGSRLNLHKTQARACRSRFVAFIFTLLTEPAAASRKMPLRVLSLQSTIPKGWCPTH